MRFPPLDTRSPLPPPEPRAPLACPPLFILLPNRVSALSKSRSTPLSSHTDRIGVRLRSFADRLFWSPVAHLSWGPTMGATQLHGAWRLLVGRLRSSTLATDVRRVHHRACDSSSRSGRQWFRPRWSASNGGNSATIVQGGLSIWIIQFLQR